MAWSTRGFESLERRTPPAVLYVAPDSRCLEATCNHRRARHRSLLVCDRGDRASGSSAGSFGAGDRALRSAVRGAPHGYRRARPGRLLALAFTIGGTLGGLAGYLGGWVDELVMRAADFVFAVPTILLAMAVVAALGPSLFHAVLAVVLVSWPGHARVVRGLVRTTMQSEYVAVGRLL